MINQSINNKMWVKLALVVTRNYNYAVNNWLYAGRAPAYISDWIHYDAYCYIVQVTNTILHSHSLHVSAAPEAYLNITVRFYLNRKYNGHSKS